MKAKSAIYSRMKNGIILRFLDRIERVGSKLPDPLLLFVLAAALVVVASWIGHSIGLSVEHPGTHEQVGVVNLLSTQGIQRMFTDAVKNFVEFPPLGLVLVTMIGIAVAERGGFITAALRATVHYVPKSLLTAALVFAGVNSSLAADAGYVVLIPLGAVVFAAVGRHPHAGLSAAFAGVAGGFTANLSITSLDPLLSGMTELAAQLIRPSYTVSAASNWYFMIASTFLITIVGTIICERIVEPRLGPWHPDGQAETQAMKERLSAAEKRGLMWSILTFVAGIVAVVLLSVPEGSVFRDDHGTLRPLEKSIVVVFMLLFLFAGLVYAVITGRIRSDKDLSVMASDGLATMGSYIVLSFVMAQFISYFAWSKLGIITAVNGATFLQSLQLPGPILLCLFVLVAALIDLLVASASAKWAIMAPVFVPMFMILGIAPEATQLAYRIGDSISNMITPMLSYVPLILYALQRYKKDSSLGTLLSLMLPYTMSLTIIWIIFMLVWLYAGIPLGPDSMPFITPPSATLP